MLLLLLATPYCHGACPGGDTVAGDDLFKLSLEDLLAVEVEVASKHPQRLIDTPSSVTVFTRSEIQLMGVQSIEELLNFVPGFISYRSAIFSEGQAVAARGRTSGHSSDSILFMIDGHRLNNDRSGGAMTVYRRIPIHNVERVEVIRGPGSALYGTNAFSGVVNIITIDQDNRIYGEVSSFGGRQAYANLSRSGDDWAVALSARWFEDDGQDYGAAYQSERVAIRDPRHGRDLSAKLCRDRLSLSFRHAQRGQGDFYMASGLLGDDTWFEDNSLRAEYRLLDKPAYGLALYANYRWQQGEEQYKLQTAEEIGLLPPEINLGGSTAPLVAVIETEEREWGLGLEGRYRLAPGHELFAGVAWRRPENVKEADRFNYAASDGGRINLFGPIEEPIRYVGGDGEETTLTPSDSRDIYSVYLQDQYEIDESWTSTVGLRYDYYDYFGGHLSPRVALLYDTHQGSAFKLIYGEAFRAPALRDHTDIFVGNPDLQPEQIKTLEAAWLQDLGIAHSTLTWFHSRNSNMAYIPEGDDARFLNADGHIDFAGVEWEIAAEPTERIWLRAAYSHLYRIEEEPRRYPRSNFSFIANYRHANWNLNLSAYYRSETEQRSFVFPKSYLLDDYWLANVRLRYELNPAVTLSAALYNLLDTEYGSPTGFPSEEGLPNRGRSYALGVEVSF
jgi:iron complex outermembrane receptor protein